MIRRQRDGALHPEDRFLALTGIHQRARTTVMGLDRTWELVEYGIEVRDRPLALAGAITGPAQKQQRADRIRCGIMCFLEKPQGVLVMGQTAQGTGVIAFNFQIVRSKLAGLFEIFPGQ